MFDNNWELIGRFGYVDTDCHGTTMINAFGCLPDCPWVSNGNQKNFTGSKLYDKVYSWYLGANYYLMNRAIKASVGYEGARFKDSYFGGTGGLNNSFCGQSASASAIRASVQLVF